MSAESTDSGVIVAASAVPEGAAGFVDGQFLLAGSPIPVEDPACASVIFHAGGADEAAVDAAVRSASAAAIAWAARPARERARILAACATGIRSHGPALAALESLDTGKPLSQAGTDVETSATYFEFYAGIADKFGGDTIPSATDTLVYTVREPYGVVAHITPWNSPLAQMSRGVAPSLAGGNAVVVKPSEVTPLSTLMMGWVLIEAGLPVGLYNVVVGLGASTGSALVAHPLVDHLTFTGSVATGSAVMALAAQRVVGCNLELGGKSPTIVMPDADIALAARTAAAAVVRNSGQSCFATTRMLVHESVHDEFVAACTAAMQGLSVGRGLDDPDLGPLSSAPHLAKVRRFIDDAISDGARLAHGGPDVDLHLAANLSAGHFLAPTLLVGVENSARIAQQEVFGPVQCVIPFSTESEALAIANDSDYGLAAGIFTRDLSTAHRIAGCLQAGQVQVNRYPAGGVETPFGGYKQSGIGREKGLEALRHYTQLKTVIVAIDQAVS